MRLASIVTCALAVGLGALSTSAPLVAESPAAVHHPAAPLAKTTPPPLRCREGVPEAWSVLDNASGVNYLPEGGGNVLCNYQVFTGSGVAGVAVTIEYYCAATDAAEAFTGKTGERDTQTFRSDTKLVIAEGPAATVPLDKIDPHREGVFSTFFPDTDFALFEKAWVRYNDQTVATLVVLTNDLTGLRIDFPVEDVGRIVAAAHVPAPTASCTIAPVGTPEMLPGSPQEEAAATGGKGGGGRGVMIAAGGTAIAVGGVVVWRRKPSSKRPRPPIDRRSTPRMPPKCVGIEESYLRSRETLLTLQEAYPEMSEHLRVASRNQDLNIMRIKLLLGAHLGRTIGSVTAVRFRPAATKPFQSGSSFGGFTDMPITGPWAAALDKAKRHLGSAGSAVAAARRRLAEAASKLSFDKILDHPDIRRAMDSVAVSRARFARLTNEALDGVMRLRDATFEQMQRAKVTFDGHLDYLRTLEAKHSQLTAELKQGVGTPSGRGAMSRQRKEVFDQIRHAQARQRDLRTMVDSVRMRRDALQSEFTSVVNGTRPDLAAFRNSHTNLVSEAEAVRHRLVGRAVEARRVAERALEQATMTESLAAAAVDGVTANGWRQGASVAPAAAPSFAGQAVSTGLSWAGALVDPLGTLVERLINPLQPMDEAWEILTRGQRRIIEITNRVAAVEYAMTRQRVTVRTRHAELTKCLESQVVRPPTATEQGLPEPSTGET